MADLGGGGNNTKAITETIPIEEIIPKPQKTLKPNIYNNLAINVQNFLPF